MNESKAIDLCLRRRDPAGFNYLVEHFREQAFRHAYGFMGNREDAKDACQDAFRKAFVAMPKLKELERFYPWFYSILRNQCLNTLCRRKTALSKRSEVERQMTERGSGRLPSGAMEQEEDAAMVRTVLESLKPEFREILILKYFSEYSYEEIATTLGICRGTVMSRLYYARSAFRDALDKQELKENGRIMG
ncbi:RNA polymerase sigma factor [Pelagicoccus sp. SDUM812003]|uniref:RNA polymerase sigma factor n=1 Tax=Pelagicoccus sp. SDUM812003 TaxID=3041267 RepID=UPI00281038C8|nr:RNA polymerase sigma factor [Pelagicoccus sp. SDUM812003]MDQ8203004.1 RNA polymerase sigma factor [Pelagicoccus sp. SDUM812003]